MRYEKLKLEINSFDERRDVIIPGNKQQTIAFCIDHFLDIAYFSIQKQGHFAVALAGGSTPKAIFEGLCHPQYRHKIDWGKVLLFWSDERCVSIEHPESNYQMAMQSGLASLPIDQQNIFRMKGELDPQQAAHEYEKILKDKLPKSGFDFVMLGMGEDGHTASLFPHTSGLQETKHWVTANFIPQKAVWRITLTFNCINSAKHIVVYVIGESKAQVLSKVLSSNFQPEDLPAQRLGLPTQKALWIADEAAGKELMKIKPN